MAVTIDVITAAIGIITAASTVVLAIITWRYVRLTKDYVRLTRDTLEGNRQMRLDAQKPEIAITVRRIATDKKQEVARVELYVENIGGGPATDVKFTIDSNFRVPGHEWIRDIDFVKHGIGYFQPRDIKVCPFHYDTTDGYDELMQTPLDIKMIYKDSLHNEYDVCRRINFREHENELR